MRPFSTKWSPKPLYNRNFSHFFLIGKIALVPLDLVARWYGVTATLSAYAAYAVSTAESSDGRSSAVPDERHPRQLPLCLTARQGRHLLGWFVWGANGITLARATVLHRHRLLRALTCLRHLSANEIPPVIRGTVAADETSRGGAPKNKLSNHDFARTRPSKTGWRHSRAPQQCDENSLLLTSIHTPQSRALSSGDPPRDPTCLYPTSHRTI